MPDEKKKYHPEAEKIVNEICDESHPGFKDMKMALSRILSDEPVSDDRNIVELLASMKRILSEDT